MFLIPYSLILLLTTSVSFRLGFAVNSQDEIQKYEIENKTITPESKTSDASESKDSQQEKVNEVTLTNQTLAPESKDSQQEKVNEVTLPNQTLTEQTQSSQVIIDKNKLQVVNIEIKEGHFIPNYIEIHDQSRAKLIITNNDDVAAEFESHQLNREKIIPSKGQITVSLPKLNPGEYKFENDFNKNGQGILKVIEWKKFSKSEDK